MVNSQKKYVKNMEPVNKSKYGLSY